MRESFVAVAVVVPEEQFPDGDEICLTAARFVCTRLEQHLVQHGHVIADWIQGGCDEDWGVYFESQWQGTVFQYFIGYFPGSLETQENQMLLQYQARQPFLKWLFWQPKRLLPDDPLHPTMQAFGELFPLSRMLTQSQFEAEC